MKMDRARISDPHAAHWILISCFAGLLYFGLAAAMIYLTTEHGSIATIWPADAVVLAITLHRPRTQWWSILLAALLGNAFANMLMRDVYGGAFLFGMANMTGILIAASALHGPVSKSGLLNSPGALAKFVIWAGIISPGASAFCGATAAWALSYQPFTTSFVTWMLADSLGQMILTPFLFALLGGDYIHSFAKSSPARRLEAVALLMLTALVTCFVFSRTYPAVFLIYMPVMLVAFRLNWLGTQLAVMIVAFIGAIAIMANIGPIPLLTPNRVVQAFSFQFVLVAMLITILPISVALAARRKLMRELQESEGSLRLLATQSPILLLTFDLSGRCMKALGQSQMLLGRDTDSLLGHRFSDISEEGGLLLRAAHEQAIDEPDSIQSVEFRAFRINGKWLEATFRTTADNNGRCLGTLATIHDITERKQQQLILARSASTDSLTGVLNRAGFLARLDLVLSNATDRAVSLAIIDVDRFKLINDNAGHWAGDAVLREIAARIVTEVRSSDAVGRLGGDEFILLLTTANWDRVRQICNRVVNAVSAQAIDLPSGGQLKTAISCGVVQYRSGLSAEEFIHEADLALYEAKRGGRNRVVAA